MKDIGSIFPLYYRNYHTEGVKHTPCLQDGKIYYSLCREALYEIANVHRNTSKVVMLPAYTCDTVITPFKEQGWQCFYFPVNKNLRIDINNTLELWNKIKADLIVVHPYFGMDLSLDEIALLKGLHELGCRIVADLTQCIFSEQRLDFVDYYVGSYRKWFAIPDGSFLQARNGVSFKKYDMSENKEFVSLQQDAMYLRGFYFSSDIEELKKISIRLNKLAVESVDFNIKPHRMSDLSYTLYIDEDKRNNQEQRFLNYKYLHERLCHNSVCRVVCDDIRLVTTAPLYFPVYVDDRRALQYQLAKEHVYAPIIWPVYYEEVLLNDEIKEIYTTSLAIPIDQRYNQEDMEKIVQIIQRFVNE